MSTKDPNRARMIPAPTPIFQPGPGARAREGGAPPNTGYNTSAFDAEAGYLSSMPPRTSLSIPQFSEEARGALMGGLGANLALRDQIPAFEAWTMRRYNNAQQPAGNAFDAEANYLSSLPPRTSLSPTQFSGSSQGELMGGLGANLSFVDQIPGFEAWTMSRYNNPNNNPASDAYGGQVQAKGGAVNLQTGPVDYGGQHAALGRYRPPMFDLQGNPDPRDLGGYAYNLPNQYGPYPLNQYAGRFMAQDIYSNRTLAEMLANRQTGIIDMLRTGLLRMLASNPQAAYTVPPVQTQPVAPTEPEPEQPPIVEPAPPSNPQPPPPAPPPGYGGPDRIEPFRPEKASGWNRFRMRRGYVAPVPKIRTP